MRAEKIVAWDLGSKDQSLVTEARITPEGKVEVERLFSLDQPSLRALSFILRHKELWPEGFIWDYSECASCAMGMASALWNLKIMEISQSATATLISYLPMDRVAALSIFCAQASEISGCNPAYFYGVTFMSDVTPEMVADKIDEYLARTGK